MKKVKECPECGHYNPRRKEICENENCGCRLDGVLTIEVEDDLTENPNFGLFVEPQSEGLDFLFEQKDAPHKQDPQNQCKICGTAYSIEQPDKAQHCKVCKHIVYNPFVSQDAPQEPPRSSTAENRATAQSKTYVIPQAKVLSFVSSAGHDRFSLSFEAEPKSFGRNYSDLETIRGNHYISREHISYYLQNGKAYVVDTSANGTYINGSKLKKDTAYPLEIGDRIRFYNEEFTVKNGD